jgi:sporulation protein YlmC with PRC-barrel domain
VYIFQISLFKKESVMQRLRSVVFVLSVFGLVPFIAQNAVAATPDQPQRSTQIDVNRNGVHIESGAEMHSGHVMAARAKDLIGLSVKNPNDESLGKVEDLVIDTSNGKIRYAVLSFGGFLGMGDKYFAVPWDDLKMHSKGTTSSGTIKEDYYVLDVSKDSLKNAPGFDKSQWPNFADPNWSVNIDRFYNDYRRANRPAPAYR